MIILKEAEKISFNDYLDEVSSFFSALSNIFAKLHKMPDLFESDKSFSELQKAYDKFKKETEESYKTFEDTIMNSFKAIEIKLAQGKVDKKGINALSANRTIRKMNNFITVIQEFKEDLPISLNTLTDQINKYIDSLNKEIASFKKIPNSMNIPEIKKLK